jgi:hypothetical protein
MIKVETILNTARELNVNAAIEIRNPTNYRGMFWLG